MRHLDDSLYRGLGKIRLLEVGKETDNKTGCFFDFYGFHGFISCFRPIE